MPRAPLTMTFLCNKHEEKLVKQRERKTLKEKQIRRIPTKVVFMTGLPITGQRTVVTRILQEQQPTPPGSNSLTDLDLSTI